jgi:hypothetical protein
MLQEGVGGWAGQWNLGSVSELAKAIADSIMGQFEEYGSTFEFAKQASGSAAPAGDNDRRL